MLLEIPCLPHSDEPDWCRGSIPSPRVVFLEVTGFIFISLPDKSMWKVGVVSKLVGVLWQCLPSLYEDSLFFVKKKKKRMGPPHLCPRTSGVISCPRQGFRVTRCCTGLRVFWNPFAVWLMRTAFENWLRAWGPWARCSDGSPVPWQGGWVLGGWLRGWGLLVWWFGTAGSPATAYRFHPLAWKERPDFSVCAAQFSYATFEHCARWRVCVHVCLCVCACRGWEGEVDAHTPSQGAFY